MGTTGSWRRTESEADSQVSSGFQSQPSAVGTVDFEDLDALAAGFNLTPRGLYTHAPAPGRIGVVDFDGERTRPRARARRQEKI